MNNESNIQDNKSNHFFTVEDKFLVSYIPKNVLTGGESVLYVDFFVFDLNDFHNTRHESIQDFLDSKDSDEEIFVHGYVKWDGCSNWDNGNVMMHFCDTQSIDSFSNTLKACHEKAEHFFEEN